MLATNAGLLTPILGDPTPWSPQRLYTSGEAGLWYDASQLTPEKVAWRRNLLTWSEDFSNAAWTKTNVTVTANAGVAPDGTTTASLVVPNTLSGNHFVRQDVGATGLPSTLSIYAKASGYSILWISPDGGSNALWFDLSNGTTGGTGVPTGSIAAVGNGWYRCTYAVSTRGSIANFFFVSQSTASISFAGDGTSGVLLWGAQFDQRLGASSYQRITDFTSDFLAAFPTHGLYQDSAGNTPVTALGQPVGLVLDSARGGLAAIGATVLSDGDFATGTPWTAGTGWSIGSGVATKTAGTASGLTQAVTVTAGRTYQITYTLTRSAGTLTPQLTGGTTVSATARSASGTYTEYFTAVTGNTTFSLSGDASFAGTVDNVSVREVPGVHAIQPTSASRPALNARVNLLAGTTTMATQTAAVLATSYILSFSGTGTVTLSGASTAGPLVGTGIGQRVSLTFTPTAGTLTLTVSGTVTDADLRLATNAAYPYQRVTTATDYADVGVPRQFTFDGLDDSLYTAANLDLSGTDKVTVCAGVYKNSDAAAGIVSELGSSLPIGGFYLAAPFNSATPDYAFASRGNGSGAAASYNNAAVAAPNASVLTGLGDINAPSIILRSDAIQRAQVVTSTGSGNYSSAVLNIGRRNNASLPFNGGLAQLIVRGTLTDAGLLALTERYVGAKMDKVL